MLMRSDTHQRRKPKWPKASDVGDSLSRLRTGFRCKDLKIIASCIQQCMKMKSQND